MTEKKSLWQIGFSGAPVIDAPLTYLDAQVGRDGEAFTFPLQAVGVPANGIMFPLMPKPDCVWSDDFVGVDFAALDGEKWAGDLSAFYILENEMYFEGVDGHFEAISRADYSTVNPVEILVKLKECGFDDTLDYPSGSFGVFVNGNLYDWTKDIYDMDTLECGATFHGESVDCSYSELWVSIDIVDGHLDVAYSVDFGVSWTHVESRILSGAINIGIAASGYGGWNFSADAFQVLSDCPPA
jgi:hypothetical protein